MYSTYLSHSRYSSHYTSNPKVTLTNFKHNLQINANSLFLFLFVFVILVSRSWFRSRSFDASQRIFWTASDSLKEIVNDNNNLRIVLVSRPRWGKSFYPIHPFCIRSQTKVIIDSIWKLFPAFFIIFSSQGYEMKKWIADRLSGNQRTPPCPFTDLSWRFHKSKQSWSL